MSDESGMIPARGGGDIGFVLPLPKVYTSLDLTNKANAAMFLKAKASTDFDFDDVHGQTISVNNVIIHECELTSQDTGEVFKAWRTILLCEDGSSAGFVSKGVIGSLADLNLIYGPMPWVPAVKLSVESKKRKPVGHVYFLTVKE